MYVMMLVVTSSDITEILLGHYTSEQLFQQTLP